MKKVLLASAMTALLFIVGCSQSEEEAIENYPDKTIEIVAPYTPGGDTDFNARAYSEFLSDELDVDVVIKNIEGTGGVVGSTEVKDANPDGYTVLFMHPALIVNNVAGNSDYGIDAFEYVATAGESPGEIITVNSDSGFEDLDDLVEYSKEHPGEINVAADAGTMTHVIALQLVEAGADVDIISAGGASERVADLKGGHIDVIINSYGTIADYLETGEFTALASTNKERSEGFPDIPTAVEQGYDVSFEKYYFFAMPEDTPEEIVDAFSNAVETVSEKEEYAEMIFDSYKQTPLYKSPEEGLNDMERITDFVEEYESNF